MSLKHYESVILIHPDHGGDIPQTIERFKNFLTKDGGKVHRAEDWGKILMAYTISDTKKAVYLLFNFEVTAEKQREFQEFLDFNDAVIRRLIFNVKSAETKETAMALLARDENFNAKKIAVKFPKDYKNIPWMQSNLNPTGTIMPARNTELSSADQRKLSHSVKIARYLALIQYCDRHS